MAFANEKSTVSENVVLALPAPGRGRYDRAQSKENREEEQILRLLDATMEVMIEHGYAKATVAKICERAGMSRATFYAHFSGLRPALLALHHRVGGDVFEHLQQLFQGIDDPFERLRLGVSGFMEIIAENPGKARVIFREIRSAGPSYEIHREAQIDRYVQMLLKDAKQAFDDGLITRLPEEIMIYSLVAGMEAVAMRYVLQGKGEQVKEAAPILVDLVMRALI